MAATVLQQDTTHDTHETQGLTSRLIQLEDQYGTHNYKPLDVVVERASGVWVYDVEGRRYLDCLAAYSAVNQGHCHPRILAAMIEQAHKVTLTSRAFRNDQLPRFLEDLHNLTGYEMALLMNSGTEAVESAIKVARKWGYKVKGIPDNQAEIIVCTNNFHGRTISIVSFSTDEQYRDGFGPFLSGFKIIPFGDAAALRAAITPNTAAFLVEPIQGEAGVLIPPDGFLAEAAAICKQNNVLLDGRRDPVRPRPHRQALRLRARGISPDVLIIGKALAGGFYPVSAVLTSREVLGVITPGDHGSTFGGNPMACAVARASLKVIVEEHLADRSAELGTLFISRLRQIKSPHIVEIRGRGLWIAIELDYPCPPNLRSPHARGHPLQRDARQHYPLCPPLIIEKEELLWAADRIQSVIERL